MNKIQVYGLICNLILYLIMIFPIFFIISRKKIYSSKNQLISSFIYITSYEILFSFCIYFFPEFIFSLFTKTTGIINYSIYASKILFISSSLYGIKFLVPSILCHINKKTVILVLSKITVQILLTLIGYNLFSLKGLLYSFPICDFIYYIIYIMLIIKNLKYIND